ncbi:MAG: MerR family transcriptional regulator [Prevotellaceae bacterium]|jgi:DNA-binding transcriptional MerR regulator|nr:MerR family transcriptional regulator [Prevotellaceae bacterium]
MEKKDLKLYYSIGEVAAQFGLSESTLRSWERQFPRLKPKRGGRGVRQYRKEDIDTIGIIYHQVKEKGLRLANVRKKMKVNPECTDCQYEVIERLRAVRDELLAMQKSLESFR